MSVISRNPNFHKKAELPKLPAISLTDLEAQKNLIRNQSPMQARALDQDVNALWVTFSEIIF